MPTRPARIQGATREPRLQSRRAVFGMRIVVSALAAAAMASFASPAYAAPVPEEACKHIFTETGVPEIEGDVTNSESGEDAHVFVCRHGYALFFNTATQIPDWVAEDITLDEITGDAERLDNFAVDPLVLPPVGSSLKDYSSSGFDRGHQAPAADFKDSQQSMDESFFLSNMAPQVGSCFNRGIWAQLEDEVRSWAPTRKRLIVFTGPIYPDPIETIADRVPAKPGVRVAVAQSFYKIVYHPRLRQAVAFIIPNERLCGEDARDFVVSIDEIEELTGIDFLPALPQRTERSLERNRGNLWGW